MIEHKLFQNPKRKTQITNFIIEFLQSIQMTSTAHTLAQQSNLNHHHQNLNQQIESIQSNNFSKQQKQQLIKNLLEKQYIQHIKKDQHEQALKLLSGPMTQYFDNTDKFATYFIDLPQNNIPQLNKFMIPYFSRTKNIKLPKYKAYKTKLNNQIWFIKSNGIFTVAVDNLASLTMFKNYSIVAQKQRAHDKYITTIKWMNINSFCTAGADTKVKLWNQKLQCIKIISHHQKYVSSITFTDKYIISAGHDNFILFTDKNQIQKSSKMTSQVVQDMHYLNSKEKLITISHTKNRSIMHLFNLAQRQQQKYISVGDKVFGLQVSFCENYLYLNCKSQQIWMYHTNSLSLYRKFTGFCQQNFIMRMSIGGQNDQYLAVPSESSQILFFHSSRSQPVHRIKIVQKTVVNCVSWINKDEIILGCDNGNVQIWSLEQKQFNKVNQMRDSQQSPFDIFRSIYL